MQVGCGNQPLNIRKVLCGQKKVLTADAEYGIVHKLICFDKIRQQNSKKRN